MSEMSFKQAKELIEKIELTELSLNNTLENMNQATVKFDKTLETQEEILNHIPKQDKKLLLMKLIVALNVGFLLGLVTAKILF